jgi:hypothetical protein
MAYGGTGFGPRSADGRRPSLIFISGRVGTVAYKFEDLEVWQKALDYADKIYDIAEDLPSTSAITWGIR